MPVQARDFAFLRNVRKALHLDEYFVYFSGGKTTGAWSLPLHLGAKLRIMEAHNYVLPEPLWRGRGSLPVTFYFTLRKSAVGPGFFCDPHQIWYSWIRAS